jgi:serpin B
MRDGPVPPLPRSTAWRRCAARTGLLAALALVLAACRPPTPPVDARSAQGAATASNRFGFDVYDELRDAPGNLVFSPASAEIALAMTAAGARGKTLDAMAKVLHADRLGDSHASFGSLLRSLNGRDGDQGVTIHLADRLWAQKGLPFRTEFVALMKDAYAAPLGEVDYEHAPEAAVAAINAWANEETRGRIPQILDEVPDTARLVLGNAVYFKGAWRKAFREASTTDEDFTTPGASPEKAKVRMMHQQTSFRYARVDGAQLVELPYKGAFAMVVVLPDAANGLSSIERRARSEYDAWVANLEDSAVDLALPRWKLESSYELAPVLKDLGMGLAFRPDADFSGMTDKANLDIDRVVQKAVVESNETGSEAAAVTTVVMTLDDGFGDPEPPPAVVHADHPFLYFIRDPSTGVVLFMGRVVRPR